MSSSIDWKTLGINAQRTAEQSRQQEADRLAQEKVTQATYRPPLQLILDNVRTLCTAAIAAYNLGVSKQELRLWLGNSYVDSFQIGRPSGTSGYGPSTLYFMTKEGSLSWECYLQNDHYGAPDGRRRYAGLPDPQLVCDEALCFLISHAEQPRISRGLGRMPQIP